MARPRIRSRAVIPAHFAPGEFGAYVERQVRDWAPAIKTAEVKP